LYVCSMNAWGGQILRASAAALVAEELPAVEPPGVAIEQMLDGMQRQGTFAELAARQGSGSRSMRSRCCWANPRRWRDS